MRYIWILSLLTITAIFFTYCIPVTSHNPWITQHSELDDDSEGDSNEDQNQEEESENKDSENESQDPLDKKQSPYEIQIDTIASMSCTQLSKGSSFSTKFLVTNRGGVKLKDSFLEKNVSEIQQYPYSKAYPVLTLSPSIGSNSTHSSFWIKLNRINLKRYINDLLKSSRYINRFGNHSIQFTQDQYHNLESTSNEGVFVIGFNHTSKRVQHFTRGGDTMLHGRYYETSVENINLRPVMNRISEWDSHSDSTRSWDCPQGLRLQIYRHPEEGKENISCEDSNENHSQHQMIQKVVGSQWNINTEKGCISPKTKGRIKCYNSRVSSIQYNDQCSNNITQYCPHYLSICLR